MWDFQRLSSFSFNLIKFILDISSEMLKVFQKNIPLSSILLLLTLFIASGVAFIIQLLALVNFGVSAGSLRSSSFGIIVYNKINSAISPKEGILSNLLVF